LIELKIVKFGGFECREILQYKNAVFKAKLSQTFCSRQGKTRNLKIAKKVRSLKQAVAKKIEKSWRLHIKTALPCLHIL
jgi:hypothetical protein